MNELFFIALYLLSFSSPTLTPSVLENRNASGAQSTSAQIWSSPWSAGAMELARANKIDSAVPRKLLAVSSVFMILKQYVNVIQLIEASKWIVQGDMEIRRNQPSQKKG
ncbi:CDP-diacylglycerol-inositol 3-phosphatidyltransferase [Aspergillus tanneri]|uniref:CDP-diacylglycerol-inositol 3-phosphatidyltransferase n=1 Tax=Aspergillus tanneri TaxID=1220188 RepID=A0A5M9MN06_9EURO|nr:CDP-diacylglycerol-inositol 3-phosphatidyltransferase [Aspergillus tanneri]KAA8648412.1 CDP-diacylglycerol-inositol 3-phosphatidyltransferase [Aspergillus tanneri]